MTKSNTTRFMHRARTPRAAAIAGILFSLLFSSCIMLVQRAMPPSSTDPNAWTDATRRILSISLTLLPLAGLAFLWFIGVVRDRLGAFEDQLFATVFQASGVLFLAMTFGAFAIAAGMLAAYHIGGNQVITPSIYVVGRCIMDQVFNTYALKMAAVFMVSLSTLWLRTGVMPRWLCFLTYGAALIMFVSLPLSLWMVLWFPAWVLGVSVYILFLSYRQKPSGDGNGAPLNPQTS